MVSGEFWRGASFRVGNGRKVKFWKDLWCGRAPLATVFPGLYRLAMDTEATVSDYRVIQGVDFFWDVVLRRGLRDWEFGEMVDLLVMLYVVNRVERDEDVVFWDRGRGGRFTVASFYHLLCPSSDVAFPSKSIWGVGAPSKVCFFVWTEALNRILTIDNLIRKRCVLVNWCCMCKRDEETVAHLLLHCPVAVKLWYLIFSLFGIMWVQHKDVCSVLLSWRGARIGRRRRKAWSLAPLCLMWLLWGERNRRIFQGAEMSALAFRSQFLRILQFWVVGRVDPSLDAALDFIDVIA